MSLACCIAAPPNQIAEAIGVNGVTIFNVKRHYLDADFEAALYWRHPTRQGHRTGLLESA